MDPTWPPIHEDDLDPKSLRPSWDYRYAPPCFYGGRGIINLKFFYILGKHY